MSSERLSPNVDFSAHGRCLARFFQSRASSSERKTNGRADRKSIAESIQKTSENPYEIDREIDRRHNRTDDRNKVDKNFENRGVLANKIKPQTVRATLNRAQAALFERQTAKKSHEAMRFFFKVKSNEPVGARKCAPRVQKRTQRGGTPECPI